jgi:hypothetical protein
MLIRIPTHMLQMDTPDSTLPGTLTTLLTQQQATVNHSSSPTSRLASLYSQTTVNLTLHHLLRLPPTRPSSPRASVSVSRCLHLLLTVIPISHPLVPLPNLVLEGSEIPGWVLLPLCLRGAILPHTHLPVPATDPILPPQIPQSAVPHP